MSTRKQTSEIREYKHGKLSLKSSSKDKLMNRLIIYHFILISIKEIVLIISLIAGLFAAAQLLKYGIFIYGF